MYKSNNKAERIEIGKALLREKSNIYTSRILDTINAKIEKMRPNATQDEREAILYHSIYDYWAYGNNIGEEFYLGFLDNDENFKDEYITFRNRYLYTNHLNKKEDEYILQDKYEAYKRLKPYFNRDIIEICSEDDFPLFKEFVSKHPTFVVKPTDLGLAIGVHKETITEDTDLHSLFLQILDEGKINLQNNPWGKKSSIVIEELIVQSDIMASFHPQSVNSVRVTTVRINNDIYIWYPWLKIGINGGFVTSAAFDTLDAGIDATTGIVNTDAFDENCNVFVNHPNTGVKFKGFQIPKWQELINLIKEISNKLPSLGYVGWDMVLTDNGWVVMEGNVNGEFMGQLVHQKGMKKEFEKLIDWKPQNEFWWQK